MAGTTQRDLAYQRHDVAGSWAGALARQGTAVAGRPSLLPRGGSVRVSMSEVVRAGLPEHLSNSVNGSVDMKNVVVCCDGTANEFAQDRTNVVKLFYALDHDPTRQVTFYHPGLRSEEHTSELQSRFGISY